MGNIRGYKPIKFVEGIMVRSLTIRRKIIEKKEKRNR
jgi:hypothetical protein